MSRRAGRKAACRIQKQVFYGIGLSGLFPPIQLYLLAITLPRGLHLLASVTKVRRQIPRQMEPGVEVSPGSGASMSHQLGLDLSR